MAARIAEPPGENARPSVRVADDSPDHDLWFDETVERAPPI